MYILESTDTDISLPRKTTSERRPEFRHFNKKKTKLFGPEVFFFWF